MKYEKMIQSILEEVGGQENIENVYHCATRLRFQLKDETKANDEAVKAIDGVLSIVKGGGQYQIVIGQHVADVYNELQTMMGTTEKEVELKDAKEFKQEMKKKKISNQFIDVISGVFTPVLGMLTATGVIKGLLAFLAATGLLATTSGTYQMLNIVGDCFFNFLPIFFNEEIWWNTVYRNGNRSSIGISVSNNNHGWRCTLYFIQWHYLPDRCICRISWNSGSFNELCKFCNSSNSNLLLCSKN